MNLSSRGIRYLDWSQRRKFSITYSTSKRSGLSLICRKDNPAATNYFGGRKMASILNLFSDFIAEATIAILLASYLLWWVRIEEKKALTAR